MKGPDWVGDVAELHQKFRVEGVGERLFDLVRAMPEGRRREFLGFRMRFLREELTELETAETAEDFVDALVDLCVVAIGTMDAFGVDADKAWLEVHCANAAKEPGVKPGRPNPLGLPDLLKPEGWRSPDHSGNIGLLGGLL